MSMNKFTHAVLLLSTAVLITSLAQAQPSKSAPTETRSYRVGGRNCIVGKQPWHGCVSCVTREGNLPVASRVWGNNVIAASEPHGPD